ncbi:MAG TPA: alpha/beta hydrolase [Burkholderiales bacterium]|nr:alpha/beta hydrolase [Burkholderiales bacterium]
MNDQRRTILKGMTAMAAAGVSGIATAKSGYDPKAKFELKVSKVPFRKNAKGRQLMARIYQPVGTGPFPVVLDLHGGAWQRKDRTAEEPMDRAIAASGVLVVAIDMTLSGEAPYPACIQDASYGIRWLKVRAKEWKGDALTLGLYGSSSGGHVAEMLMLRPNDARYNAIPLEGEAKTDTSVAYVATRSPISDTFARWEQAVRKPNENLQKASKMFFNPWETIHEGNPLEILERKEKVGMRPLLIMQGALDDNVLPAAQEKFVRTFKAAGGDVTFKIFENSVHEWVAEPGPQTTAAQEMVKAFIAKQLSV